MSYINDALRKAQKEKDNLYRRCNTIISSPVYRQCNKKPKWMAATVIISILIAVSVFFSLRHHNLCGTDGDKKTPAHLQEIAKDTRPQVPEKAPAISQEVKKLYKEAFNHQRDNDLTRAKELYRKTLEIDHEFVFALNNLGVIYMEQKRNNEAVSLFKKAIDLQTDYIDPYYNLACLYSQSGNIPEGIDYLKKAISINNNVKAWAKDDKDLENLRASAGYKKMEASAGSTD